MTESHDLHQSGVATFFIELDYDRTLWQNTSKIATPFWVGICNHDWEQTDEMLQVMRHIEIEHKDDETYDWVFLALEPLTNATLEEVARFKATNLKIYWYV